jgi:tubulin--tyrosine ligase
VVVPSQQRSWIGKAHLLPASTYQGPNKPVPQSHEESENKSETAKAGGEGDVYGGQNAKVDDALRPTYLDPKTGTIHAHHRDVPKGSSAESPPYWALVPGTPATCSQLGLFHHSTLFPAPTAYPPIDLVVSGPNHGRNTTAAFALSSGTLGGALEAAIADYRAIALSFAFFTKTESQELIQEACELSAKIIGQLAADWDKLPAQARPDVYSINVPLVEGIAAKEVKWTWMLDNRWTGGHGLYARLSDDKDAPPVFKWSPSFGDIWKTVEQSDEGNDGLAIRQGVTSVTPLKANFATLYGAGDFKGSMKL